MGIRNQYSSEDFFEFRIIVKRWESGISIWVKRIFQLELIVKRWESQISIWVKFIFELLGNSIRVKINFEFKIIVKRWESGISIWVQKSFQFIKCSSFLYFWQQCCFQQRKMFDFSFQMIYVKLNFVIFLYKNANFR